MSARATVRRSPAIESEVYFPLAVASVFPFNVHSENRSRQLARFAKEDGVIRGVSQDRVRRFGQCQDAGRVLEAAGSTVVLNHDGERCQEDLESSGRPRRDQRERTEWEGDIGRHRNRPATHFDASTTGDEIDQCRDQHPTDRRDDGKRRLARRRQFADERLAFDLETDQQEEDCHERVVDPLVNGERQHMPGAVNCDGRRQT